MIPRAIAVWLVLPLFCFAISLGLAQEPRPPVKVEIQEDKTEIVESIAVLAVDPTIRAQPTFINNNMAYGLNVEGSRLTFGAGSANTAFKIDEQILGPNAVSQALPNNKNGKPRQGRISVYQHGKVKITQVMEIVPGKPQGKAQPGQKRRMDTLLIHYAIENLDTQPHKVGVRMHIDTYCRSNDGCLFANPVQFPKKILNGVELKGKDVPDWLMIMERPDLDNPGFVGYFTFRCGTRLEAPSRVVLTNLGAGGDGWNVPAIQAGDSAVAFFWDQVAIPAGGKREVAFAHGGGVASGPESEGRVSLLFGGSFEPGKTFSVTAYVDDPLEGQNLTLELPAGMTRVEGKETQPVPAPLDGGTSVVSWKASVQKLGAFALKVRSSNGTTLTRNIRITAS